MPPQIAGLHSESPTDGPLASSRVAAAGPKPTPDSLVRRSGAYFIDAVILTVIANLPLPFAGLIGAIAATAGWLVRDVAVDGRSPGKALLGLKTVSTSGGEVTLDQSIRRNLPFAVMGVAAVLSHLTVPLLATPVSLVGVIITLVEGVMVLTGQQRFGDRFAGTMVVTGEVCRCTNNHPARKGRPCPYCGEDVTCA